MKNATLKEISEALDHKFFDPVREFISQSDERPAHLVKKILETPYDDLDKSPTGEKVESEPEKDVFHAWHKYRVLVVEGVEKILPKNTDTHTLVTAEGHVAVIRKPIGHVLGKVMSKIGAFNKDPDYYEAGSVIYRECKIFCEKVAENDPDALFSIKMACLGATQIVETRIKKN